MPWWVQLILTNLVSVIVSFIVGYMTNVLAGPHTRRFTDWINTGPIRKVLQLGPSDVVVVIPLHKIENGRRLPYVAVEDVYALRNVLALLAKMGRTIPSIRDPEHLDGVVTKNLITIGGPNRNSFTKYILSAQEKIKFVDDQVTGHTEIHRGTGTRHTSASYSKPEGEQSSDMAVLLRCQNPKNESNVVIVIAGIRGIGTWGASDYLRKEAEALAGELDERQKHTGFLAEIAVDYEKLDIRGKLVHIEAM